MKSEELRDYKAGDRVRMTVECDVQSPRRRFASPEDYLSVDIEDGTVHKSRIVSIERVRQRLEEPWKWSEDGTAAIYVDGLGIGVVRVWMEDGEIMVASGLSPCSVPLAVIDGVREAHHDAPSPEVLP